MPDILQYPFMQRAVLVSTLAAIPLGLLGTFIVVRRIGYLAGAVAHCAFGGIGAGLFVQYLFGLFAVYPALASSLTLPVALVFTILAALLIGVLRINAKEREDTIIGAIWAVGMSLGMIFAALTPGNVNISSYLFGDIILLSDTDVSLITALSIGVLLTILFFFQRLEAVCFDPEFASLRGVHTGRYFQLLLVLTAVSVVLFVRVIGILLLIAMLTLPAAAACRFSKRLFSIAWLAVLIALLASWGGLLLSVELNLPAGPMIVLTAAGIYFGTLCIRS